VPLDRDSNVRDLARGLALPVIVAARPGLGTINHTLLTLEAARAGGVPVTAVVMTPWPDRPDTIERSNRETIERLGDVEVGALRLVAHPDPGALARAARTLPLDRWLL
jgi:dethiobiotin synthetase